MLTKRLTAAVAAAIIAAGCLNRHSSSTVTLATTTSVANSGLLDTLVPLFQRESGIEIRPVLVGSGRALQMLAAGDADAAITHAPGMEAKALDGQIGWLYRKIMFNDFVLVGPAHDPAAIRSAPAAAAAMRRIARSDAVFVSRGDSSGTHERERRLWALAGAEPPPARLVIAGAGMGSTLRVAGTIGAYTLTDRATFAQQTGQLPLVALFDGGPELLNTYAVVVPAGTPVAEQARRFAAWLSEGNGRLAVDQFRIGAQQVQAFSPWPLDAPGDRPDARPH